MLSLYTSFCSPPWIRTSYNVNLDEGRICRRESFVYFGWVLCSSDPFLHFWLVNSKNICYSVFKDSMCWSITLCKLAVNTNFWNSPPLHGWKILNSNYQNVNVCLLCFSGNKKEQKIWTLPFPIEILLCADTYKLFEYYHLLVSFTISPLALCSE